MESGKKIKMILLFENAMEPSRFLELLRLQGFEDKVEYKVIETKTGEKFDPKPFGDQEDVVALGTSWGTLPNIKKITDANPNIRWIHTFTAGVDKLLGDDLKTIKAVFTNSKGAFSSPLAEFIIFQILWFEKRGLQWLKAKERHEWKIEQCGMIEGKTIGIIGFGDIGGQVALRSKAFKMKVIGLKRDPTKVDEQTKGMADEVVGYDKIDHLLSNSDYVVNCLPLTKDTTNYYNIELFKKMKSTAIFMNIGRGKSVVEDDLIEALEKKYIAGAFMDVVSMEPLSKDSKLWDMENVYITPHSCENTTDMWDRTVCCFLQTVDRFIKNEPFPNKIDVHKGY